MTEPCATGTKPSESGDLRAAGDQIETLLDALASLPDRRAGQWAEELVRSITAIYGAGLARVIEAATLPQAPRGTALLEFVAEDDLVASLLLVHDLHPLSPQRRAEQALSMLRTSLPQADLRLVDLDEGTSTIRLRLFVANSSPAGAAALEKRVREDLEAALPELNQVLIDRPMPSTPVRLGRRVPPPIAAEKGPAEVAVAR